MTTEPNWPPVEEGDIPPPADQTKYRRLTVNLTLTLDLDDDRRAAPIILAALEQMVADPGFRDASWKQQTTRFFAVRTGFEQDMVKLNYSFTNSFKPEDYGAERRATGDTRDGPVP
jgi:hypothetical protein